MKIHICECFSNFYFLCFFRKKEHMYLRSNVHFKQSTLYRHLPLKTLKKSPHMFTLMIHVLSLIMQGNVLRHLPLKPWCIPKIDLLAITHCEFAIVVVANKSISGNSERVPQPDPKFSQVFPSKP
jgi:hypothetical protein